MTITTAHDTDASLAAGAPRTYGEVHRSGDDHGHAVSWAAIFAGAAAAAALSLILLVLGVGLGLSSVSPWTNQGASGTAAGVGTIVWVMVEVNSAAVARVAIAHAKKPCAVSRK